MNSRRRAALRMDDLHGQKPAAARGRALPARPGAGRLPPGRRAARRTASAPPAWRRCARWSRPTSASPCCRCWRSSRRCRLRRRPPAALPRRHPEPAHRAGLAQVVRGGRLPPEAGRGDPRPAARPARPAQRAEGAARTATGRRAGSHLRRAWLLLALGLLGLGHWWFTARPVAHVPGVLVPEAPRQLALADPQPIPPPGLPAPAAGALRAPGAGAVAARLRLRCRGRAGAHRPRAGLAAHVRQRGARAHAHRPGRALVHRGAPTSRRCRSTRSRAVPPTRT